MSNRDLNNKINNLIIKLNKIETYLEKKNVGTKKFNSIESYLEKENDVSKKFNHLEINFKTLKKNKKLDSSLNNKDLENIIEDLMDVFGDIDDSLEGGLEFAGEALNTNVPKEKQPEFVKFFIFLIPVYLRWVKLNSDYKARTYKMVDVAIARNLSAKEAKEDEKVNKPQYKDLIPMFIISILTYFSIGDYNKFFTTLLDTFSPS